MTIFYLDPVNGNDANDGTTFANRWKTFTSGATSARVSAGDTVRVIKSPDPVNTGITATWTDASASVTLSSAVTANIAVCNTGWTASSNVTSTTSSTRNEGSFASTITIAAAFTTGKAAYFATGALDLSSYQQVSFWIAQTSGTVAVAGDYSITLCSDATGTTAVHTIPIPPMQFVGTVMRPITVDLGSALSSSIQSIAFNVHVDRGAASFIIDNVLACLPPSNPACLTLSHLIGPNSDGESWQPIRSINGVDIRTGTDTSQTLGVSGVSIGYSGNMTGPQPLYTLLPLSKTSAESTITGSNFGTINCYGNSTTPVYFSGGWDETNMSTQTGVTWISGTTSYGYGLNIAGTSYVDVQKIGLVKFNTGIRLFNSQWINVDTMGAIGCTNGIDITTTGTFNINLTADSVSYNGCYAGTIGGGVITTTSSATYLENSNIHINLCTGNGGYGVSLGGLLNTSVTCGTLRGNTKGNYTDITSTSSSVQITEASKPGRVAATASNQNVFVGNAVNSYYKIDLADSVLESKPNIIFNGSDSRIDITEARTYTNQPTIRFNNFSNLKSTIGTLTNYSKIETGDATYATSGTSAIYVGPTPTSSVANVGRLQLPANGAVTTNTIKTYYGTITSDTTYVHTAGANAKSWCFTPTTKATADAPLSLPLAKVYVEANLPVTFKAWFMRDTPTAYIGLQVAGNQLAGVSKTTVWSTASDDGYFHEETLTVTPTEAGVLEVKAVAYGSIYTYVDDFSVSQ